MTFRNTHVALTSRYTVCAVKRSHELDGRDVS